jgi:hypothetical protein
LLVEPESGSIIFGQQDGGLRPIPFRDDPEWNAAAAPIRRQDSVAFDKRDFVLSAIELVKVAPDTDVMAADAR